MTKRPGMTVIDLVVSLTILAIILSAVYAVFAFQQKTVRAAAEGRDVFGQALVVLDLMSRDLVGVWVPEKSIKSKIKYVFSGIKDGMSFISTSSLSYGAEPGSDLVEVQYSLEVDPDSGEARYILYRREDRTPDAEPDEGGFTILLCKDVVDFELAYMDPASGLEEEALEADSIGRLPKAVRVSLTLADPNGAEEFFTTLIEPSLSQPKMGKIEVGGLWGEGEKELDRSGK